MGVNNILDYPGEIDTYLEVQSLEEIMATVLNVDDKIEDDNMKLLIVITN